MIEFDMVIDIDTRRLPLSCDEALFGERSERRLVEAFEQLAAARFVYPHSSLVEFETKIRDAFVESIERKESLITYLRENPSLDDEYSVFDFGLVPRTARARWKDRRSVMAGHLLVRTLQSRLIATGATDAALELIGDDRFGNTADVLERAYVAGDEV